MRWGNRIAASSALLLASCGARTDLNVVTTGLDASVDAGRDAGALDAGHDAGFDAGLDASFDGGVDAGPGCRPFRGRAELASLDVFVLLDSSGSMESLTSADVTKADAVAAALTGFVEARESAGIGVALTFFPQLDESVSEHCSNDAECGPGGVCEMPDICWPSGSQLCRTARDCGTAGDECAPFGFCSGREDQTCLPEMPTCSAGSTCVDYGYCLNRTSCVPEDHAPEAPIAPLPGAAAGFVRALEARTPEGGTTTAAALEGTLDRARARRVESPGSKVIVLLATDGAPTECDPAIDMYGPPMPAAGIPLVVEIASAAAAMGIETFVVGVFEPSEETEARANLSAIASAGGTGEALIVTTTEPVTERLLAIFEDLRRTVRSCVYAIPHRGVLPEPEALRVAILPRAGEPLALERVADSDACDPRTGGFFFEPDLEMGTRPGYIELCPASCTIASRPGATLEMQADCDEP